MTEPITPDEVDEEHKKHFPQEVIQVFNEMIAKNWDGYQSFVYQKEVVKFIAKKLRISKDLVCKNHYLDVEEIYKQAGWDVTYDNPGYNESYEPSFCFKRKK